MEQLKHECGVAMIRLLKPLEYYEEKYGTWMYGLNKLYLLMEKQHNRGQEGAGLACVKLEASPGEEYMFRERALGSGAITEIFGTVQGHFKDLTKEQLHDADYAKRVLPFAGEVYMGHLRYSTTGKSGISYVHPFLRRNNWRAKNLALCGNFNMTNVDEIFARITAIGQHPRKYADTYIMLEQLGHRLDREVERLFNLAEAEGLAGMDITRYIENHIDLANVLRTSSKEWDGGYVMCGLTGSGETFAVRDPWGIRTAFWYQDDEIAVLASERPVIQTALNVPVESIKELQPGQAMFINKAGKVRTVQINKPREVKPCSFERIYFSRGSDVDIYRERKLLGEKLVPNILKAIDNDVDIPSSPSSPIRRKSPSTVCCRDWTTTSTRRRCSRLPPWGIVPATTNWSISCRGAYGARKWPSRTSSCVPSLPKETAGTTLPPMCTTSLTEALSREWIIWSSSTTR